MNAPFVETFELGGDGPRIAIKDCIDIAGHSTRAGSRALAQQPAATRHAAVVEGLLAAGWRITGKLVMHELAFGMTGINDWAGTPLNPQDPTLIPGGSSSGSAVAVGAGLVDAALGTDTGGSIRLPAACCGVPGFKPTFGRVSREGLHPAVSSLDCVGPFARNMDGITAVMTAIDPSFFPLPTPTAVRVGLVRTASDPAIVAALEERLQRTGWAVEQLELPLLDEAFGAAMTIIAAETWAAFGHLTGQDLLGADIEARLTLASQITPAKHGEAEDVRRRFVAAVDTALAGVDCLAMPTLPRLPPTLEEVRNGLPVLDLSAWVRPFNLSGHPALTLPLSLAGTHLKAGLQLVGSRVDDARLCAIGAALERY